ARYEIHRTAHGGHDRARAHAHVAADRHEDESLGRAGVHRLGTLELNATGDFFAPLLAPAVIGSYRLAYEVREKNIAVTETVTTNVTIVGPRTYPDDEGGRTPPAITITPPSTATPSPTRMRFASPTPGIVPSPQLPTLPVPRGRATPTATP